MTTKKKASREEVIDNIIDEQVNLLDKRIDRVNKLLEPFDALKQKRDRLMAAKRALTGGTRGLGGSLNRLQMRDIIDFLTENPGASPSDISKKFGVAVGTVNSALYRGKNSGRYLSKDGKWWVRDPKNGLNTEDDIEDGE